VGKVDPGSQNVESGNYRCGPRHGCGILSLDFVHIRRVVGDVEMINGDVDNEIRLKFTKMLPIGIAPLVDTEGRIVINEVFNVLNAEVHEDVAN
jgi:hypothetical protein